jgi:hypothetical protein
LNADNGEIIWTKELPYQSTLGGGIDMHSSPTVGGGMIFTSSNTKIYYGLNETNGETIWTYEDYTAGQFIICSPIYKDDKLFLINHFSIVCINAKNGRVDWSTFLGAELYVSPSYADGKLYVVTDQRFIYVLNAFNGEKLGHFIAQSNSWSSPTIYEGKMYVGTNDWKVYCFSDYPAIPSRVSVELNKSQVTLGNSVIVSGKLAPGIPNASLILTFVKPDGVMDNIEVKTLERGVYSYNYTPDFVGNWTIVTNWKSDKGYYTSAYGESQLEVVENIRLQVNDAYVIGISVVVILAIVAITMAWYMRRKQTLN